MEGKLARDPTIDRGFEALSWIQTLGQAENVTSLRWISRKNRRNLVDDCRPCNRIAPYEYVPC